MNKKTRQDFLFFFTYYYYFLLYIIIIITTLYLNHVFFSSLQKKTIINTHINTLIHNGSFWKCNHNAICLVYKLSIYILNIHTDWLVCWFSLYGSTYYWTIWTVDYINIYSTYMSKFKNIKNEEKWERERERNCAKH